MGNDAMVTDTRVPQFGGTYYRLLQGSQRRVKADAASTPKKLVRMYQYVWRHISENAIFISTAVTSSIPHMYSLHSSSAI
jgi:shikimate kinase